MAPEDSGQPRFEGVASSDGTATSPQGLSFAVSIPGYVLERRLGSGGMGAVYLARDEPLGRHVALKVVLAERASDKRVQSRFRREARAMASVEHPNVVRLYAFGSTESSSYVVMEYVEGETLAARLSRKGPLGEGEALGILRDVLLGLEAAWDKGIVHRDVKPSNVLLDAKGRARVADFGLAKSAARTVDESAITRDQGILGTPHYLSPEQAQGLPVDFRSDVYSAGLVLFEMLTGERPFAGLTPAVVVARRLTEPAPDLAAKRPGLSEKTLTTYRWMVDRLPERRPASYAELLERLEPEVAQGGGHAIAHGEVRHPGRWPWAALALGLLVIGATAVVPRMRHEGREGRVEKGSLPAPIAAHLEKRVSAGTLAVSSAYPLDVVWRGRTLARAEASPQVSLPGGEQRLVLVAASVFLRTEITVNVPPGGEAAVVAPPVGRLNVRAVPDNCRIFVDGVLLEPPPILDRPAAAGRHTVAFEWRDGTRSETDVEVKGGAPVFVVGRRD